MVAAEVKHIADAECKREHGADEERLRREVLATNREQLLKFAVLLEKISATATTCVVGGDKQVGGICAEQIRPIMKIKGD